MLATLTWERRPSAYLAVAAFVGVLTGARLGWWWIDVVAALVIAGFAVREGHAVRTERALTDARPKTARRAAAARFLLERFAKVRGSRVAAPGLTWYQYSPKGPSSDLD